MTTRLEQLKEEDTYLINTICLPKKNKRISEEGRAGNRLWLWYYQESWYFTWYFAKSRSDIEFKQMSWWFTLRCIQRPKRASDMRGNISFHDSWIKWLISNQWLDIETRAWSFLFNYSVCLKLLQNCIQFFICFTIFVTKNRFDFNVFANCFRSYNRFNS